MSVLGWQQLNRSTEGGPLSTDVPASPCGEALGDDALAAPRHRRRLNDLSAKEWLSESVSVWTQRGLGLSHPETRYERLHPAPFSFSDVARLIRMFTKEGQVVLDPFVGVGSTLKASALESRRGIGIELYPRFAELARTRLNEEVPAAYLDRHEQVVYEGDARVVLDKLPTECVDFLVTSPPYWGILNKRPDHKVKQTRVRHGLTTSYGEDTRDLANIAEYTDFVQEVSAVLTSCGRVLKTGAYLCLILGDFRHGGKYYMFHADMTRALEAEGFVLKAANVLYQRHKRVFPYGFPSAYVSNVHHQNIIVLRKEMNEDASST